MTRRLASTIAATLVAATPIACNTILGIGDPALDPGTSTATTSTGGGTTTGADGGGGGTTGQGGDGGSGGTTPPPPCAPTNPICNQVESDCIALVDNASSGAFTLRVAQVNIWKPNVFAGGVEGTLLGNSVLMNLSDCNLKGSGTFSWIFQFDETTGTGLVGAAKPAVDPFQGYSFVDETIDQAGQLFDVAPMPITGSVAADGTATTSAIDSMILPVYMNTQATDQILVPLHHVRFFDTTISSDRNCVGSYNAAGLDPQKGCLPDAAHDAFIDGGKVDGYVLLEEADTVIVTAFGLNRSLCVILSESPTLYGDGGDPMKCERIGGAIKFPGDWCSATNQGADPSCHDAVQFGTSFAASAVKLNP